MEDTANVLATNGTLGGNAINIGISDLAAFGTDVSDTSNENELEIKTQLIKTRDNNENLINVQQNKTTNKLRVALVQKLVNPHIKEII